MAVHVAPHGKIELPRWHPERHPTIQRTVGSHRGLAGLLGIALIAAVVIAGASVALTQGPQEVALVEPAGPTYDDYLNANLLHEDAPGLTTLRKVFDRTELSAIGVARTQAAALAASRQDNQSLDSSVQRLKSLSAFQWTTETLNPAALAATRAVEGTLDSQVLAIKAGTATDTTLPWRYAGKPLPL